MGLNDWARNKIESAKQAVVQHYHAYNAHRTNYRSSHSNEVSQKETESYGRQTRYIKRVNEARKSYLTAHRAQVENDNLAFEIQRKQALLNQRRAQLSDNNGGVASHIRKATSQNQPFVGGINIDLSSVVGNGGGFGPDLNSLVGSGLNLDAWVNGPKPKATQKKKKHKEATYQLVRIIH